MKKILIALAAVAIVSFAPAAMAAQATNNVTVQASVAVNCTVNAPTLNFGAYDPVFANLVANLDGTAALTVACTKGFIPTIGIAATGRTITNGTDSLTYQLYKDSGRTTVWGDTGGALLTPGSPPGRSGTGYTIYGRIPGAQDVSSGSYTGTIQAQVNY